MRMLNVISLFAITLVFTGCASIFVPNNDVIKNLPVLEMGSQQKKPDNNEYVLHIPAGAIIPVKFNLKGSLLSSPVNKVSITKINRDLYIYKYWASLDGKNWQPTRDVVAMPITLDLGPEGGRVEINVDSLK